MCQRYLMVLIISMFTSILGPASLFRPVKLKTHEDESQSHQARMPLAQNLHDLRRQLLGHTRLNDPKVFNPPPWDKNTILFFAHIPATGGTAVSWHLSAIFGPSGGIVPGSRSSAALTFTNSQLKVWASDTWGRNESLPYKVAFGHNSISNQKLGMYRGKLRFATMLRSPRSYAMHSSVNWLCVEFARRYDPWWHNKSVHPGDSPQVVDPSVWHRNASDSGTNRSRAPRIVKRFCPAQFMFGFHEYYEPEELPPTPIAQSMQSGFLGNPPANRNHTGNAAAPSMPDHKIQGPLPRALKNLMDMPWFGLLDNWAGSMCLLHYATEWPWPSETRAACSPDAELFNWTSLTYGSAALPDKRSHQYSLKEKDASRKNAHKGTYPSPANNWSVCPIRVAERLLNGSVTAQMDRWLTLRAPDLSHLVYERNNPDSSNELVLEGDESSPFRGFPVDSRGADTTMYTWAIAIFKARMREASKNLLMHGYSVKNPPLFLSPDCFLASAPDGFLVH